MTFKDFLKDNIVYLDGSMGTLLQSKGLLPGEHPEVWNITHSNVIKDIHIQYFNAGSNVVCTNTFGANSLKFDDTQLEQIIKASIENAKAAREECSNHKNKYIALDIGPLGKLLKPLGNLDFEEAVNIFKKTVCLGVKYGVDLVFIETMNDSYETKAALLAVKESCNLPIIVSNAYGKDGKLVTGATPKAMVALIEGMGADALGANCSFGPDKLKNVVEQLLENASIPVILKPNAGLPQIKNGKTVFDVSADDFAIKIAELVKKGVRAVGGCCGTTPEYIKELVAKTKGLKPIPITKNEKTLVSSYTHAVEFCNTPILIGERINPTGKKRFKQALYENDIDYILSEGTNQQNKGVHILDVNVGLPDIDEEKMLTTCVCELQAVCDLPLQIDTANISAMEAALRRYNGKAMINSVNGKAESMKSVFPLVKKYGGVVVALTLDENGIPATAEERVEIAKRILKTANEYGIDKKDIIFDTLAMTVSADINAAKVTIDALKIINNELGCHTSLGVSNVSFGLPNRDAVNGLFFALALENGLSCAIVNPYSADILKTFYTYKMLKGQDENCAEYIEQSANFQTVVSSNATSDTLSVQTTNELTDSIVKGFKEKAAKITRELLKDEQPLNIINNLIIPALNIVGEGFEKKTVFLPQLLMSAEAAKSAFSVIKESNLPTKNNKDMPTFVIATVKGDIHDIGKNIVKLLLENYGFNVIDLGKDVPPETVLKCIVENKANIVGLSALMTTTVDAMANTVKLIKQKAPWCKTVVGGAVLTREFADKMGADFYAKDAMETVRFAQSISK